ADSGEKPVRCRRSYRNGLSMNDADKTEIFWLSEIYKLLDKAKCKEPDDQTYQITATRPYIVDYRGYKYLFGYSTSSFNLTISDLGTIPIIAGQWVALWFTPGTRCYAQSQANPVTFFVRAADEWPGSISV